uniref:Uncharacterized protein n=1 Tax=Solanum tuberosum TaxID=4113 RepID=M1DB83_SOLTU
MTHTSLHPTTRVVQRIVLQPISELVDDPLLQAMRAELRAKAMQDLSRIPELLMPTPPPLAPAQTFIQAPPVKGPSPRSLKRLRVEGSRTILEEKRFSTDGVVDIYLDVWSTLKFQKFEALSLGRDTYGELVPKGKKKASSFKPSDFVFIRGRKVKRSSLDINAVLGCFWDFMHDYVDLVKKKALDDLKGWLAPLLFDVTPR